MWRYISYQNIDFIIFSWPLSMYIVLTMNCKNTCTWLVVLLDMVYRCDMAIPAIVMAPFWKFLSCARNSTYLFPHSTPQPQPPSHYPSILWTMPHLSFTGFGFDIFFRCLVCYEYVHIFWHSYGPFGLCQKHGACNLSFEIYFYTAHSCRVIKWWLPWPAI